MTIIRNNRTRNHQVLFRLNDYEFIKLDLDVKKSGLTREEYIRSLILNKEVKEQPGIDFYGFKNELNAIGRNLNQLTKKANSNNWESENIHNCISNINEMIHKVEHAVGK